MTAVQTRARVLLSSDLAPLRSLVHADRVVNCVLDARIQLIGDLDSHRLGGYVWAIDDPATGSLRAAVFHGGNLIPIGSDTVALEAIAEQLVRTARGCSSIVGTADAVNAMWPVLARCWGPARIVRPRQPLLVATTAGPVAPDPEVCPVRREELRRYLPAAVAMFTEELGVSPIGHDAGASYRKRVAELINSGRTFARFGPRGEVEFKAEIGALSDGTAQIQGVWVAPQLRGQGIGTAAMAAVLHHALRLAPTASLYVNDFNTPARRMYERLGMKQTNTLSTVLF